MGVVEGAQDLGRIADDLTQIQHLPVAHIVLERDAVHVFHDDVLDVFAHGYIIDVHNIRVGQHCDRLVFVDKPLDGRLIPGNLVLQNLHSDHAAHEQIGRLEHDRHAADTDDPFDPVAVVEDLTDVFFVIIHTVVPFGELP